MAQQQTDDAVQQLAAWIDHAGLRVPLRMALDALQPIDFLNSQMAIFARPFVRGSTWEQYAQALSDEHNWAELRRRLDHT
jgi:hypothetical protein